MIARVLWLVAGLARLACTNAVIIAVEILKLSIKNPSVLVGK